MNENETTETNGLAAAIAAHEAEKTTAPEPAYDVVPLDEALITLLAEYDQQAAALKNGALTLFVRQKKLQGQWQMGPDNRSLVRQR